MQIKTGIIGLGNIIQQHMDAISNFEEITIVCLCDIDDKKVDFYKKQFDCNGYTDYKSMLKEDIDLVVVCVPHGLHASIVIDSLKTGCHVIVEKPMAVSVGQCNEMLVAARRAKKHLIVSDSASFNSGALLTGAKFKYGQLGRFLTASIFNEREYFNPDRPSWFLDPEMSGGGMFSNVGVHRMAIARSCLPGLKPVSVCASVSRISEYPVEACTTALVKYDQGGSIVYEEVGYFPKPDWLNTGLHFVFEAGIVKWDDKTWRILKRDRIELTEHLTIQANAYEDTYRTLLKAVRGEDYHPKAWESAVDVSVAQAAYASSNMGCAIDLSDPAWTIRSDDYD